MKTQQALLLLAFTAVAGCAGSNSAVVVDPMPPGGAWLDLSLTVTGPAANDDKRKACMREARDAGVRLRANYVAMDAFSNVLAGVPMTATSVSGRAFVCATAPSPTDKPQSEGPQI